MRGGQEPTGSRYRLKPSRTTWICCKPWSDSRMYWEWHCDGYISTV